MPEFDRAAIAVGEMPAAERLETHTERNLWILSSPGQHIHKRGLLCDSYHLIEFVFPFLPNGQRIGKGFEEGLSCDLLFVVAHFRPRNWVRQLGGHDDSPDD